MNNTETELTLCTSLLHIYLHNFVLGKIENGAKDNILCILR
jgi:hypothetical protein